MNEYQAVCEICGDAFIPNGRRKKRCAKTHMKQCENQNCNNEFEITANMKITKAFCSHKCRGEASKVLRICVVCGKEFYKVSKTCSRECETKLAVNTYSKKTDAKECMLCGEEFAPRSPTQKYCSNTHYRDCQMCGKKFSFTDPLSKKKYCSSSCASKIINGKEAQERRRATSLVNFGTEFPQQTEELKNKIKQANLDKYGVEHAMMLDEFQDKVKKNNKKKYGVEHTLQIPEIRERIAKTNLEKYGHENPWGSSIIQDKIKDIFLERYGHEWANQSELVKNKRTLTNMEKYGVPNVMMLSENVIKSQETFSKTVNESGVKHRKVSLLNQKFAEKIKEEVSEVENIEFEATFGRFQADFKINDTLLIDLNPTISHNSLKSFGCVIGGCDENCEKHKLLKKNYHYQRAVEAKKNGISLVQVFEWDDEQSIIKRINAKLRKDVVKISARKMSVQKIDQSVANEFLAEVHIQGRAKGQSDCYGLFDSEDDLIAVATFGKSRFNNNYDYEFIRYAVKDGYIIHGGSGKLFKSFVDDVSPSSVISYVDFSHTTGNTFLSSLGFEEIKETGPSLVYHRIRDNKKFSNTSVVSQGADRLLGTEYGTQKESGLSNSEIMILEGFLPVYTAGNRVFVWEK